MTLRRVLIVVVALLVLAGLFLWATTPQGYSQGTGGDKIAHWDGSGEFIPDGAEGVVTLDEGDYVLLGHKTGGSRIEKWVGKHSFKVTSGNAPTNMTGVETELPISELVAESTNWKPQGCGRVVSTTQGENGIGAVVIWASLSIHWCWQGTRSDGGVSRLKNVNVDTWGGAAGWSLWSYQGVHDMVEGHGVACYCDIGVKWEYVYRRAYFEWKRGIGDFSQTATSWASATARGTGQWVTDHYTG